MAIPWGLVVIVVGVIYGYAKPGKQSKWQIFKTGLLIGIILAILFALLGSTFGLSALGIGDGFFGTIINIVILTILFIVGVWIGDLLE